MKAFTLVVVAMLVAAAHCFNAHSKASTHSKMSMVFKQPRNFLKSAIATATLAGSLSTQPVFADMKPSDFNPDIKIDVVKSAPNGDMPKPGDLVAIRFTASFNGKVFDDTFKTEQPYFYRNGVGSVVPGLDETISHMHVGDRYKLVFGGKLGFGEKSLPAAPGRPRIPPNADLEYDVELIALPGMGDDFIADVEEE
jgi:peptidylprolyl isomerase